MTSIKHAPLVHTTLTTCPYCGVGCGVRAAVNLDGIIAVSGDDAHPANRGRLCVKGSALGETVGLEGRLLLPKMRPNGVGKERPLQRVSWDQALDRVASGFRQIIDQHGPDAVALYVSGQLLTEDYYVANKFMKGYIGSANIDTNSRLCMSSAVAGHKRAFGADLVPTCYEDLELADLIVLVGSNTAWCHPILFQRIAQLKDKKPQLKLVVVDPRRTATCELADLHLPVKAGTDVWLFNGLLSYLAQQNCVDRGFVDLHTTGSGDALNMAARDCGDTAEVARVCGIDPDALRHFYQVFAGTEKVVTAFSQGVNQSSAGTDKVNSIINCHLYTGRIGKPGMGPFSLTGQPNAMGGREVGGLANLLAAHLDLDKEHHRNTVQTFWDSPSIASKPGLKALELFQAIEAGRVKAVWIMATNPLVSLPDANQAKRALSACELVVVSDITEKTDTSELADVLLPALGWGEKDGTVTNSERRISRQRAFLPAPGEARADWAIICDVAKRMGFAGFEFNGAHAVFDEHARLSAFGNNASLPRLFNLAGLSGLSRQEYDQLQPVQWPILEKAGTGAKGTARLFSDSRFAHADLKARFIATPPKMPRYALEAEFPLVLNTGRVRDQWHTMTRTGKAPKLADHIAEPFVDIHPQDALVYGVREGELAQVGTRWGAMVARVQHTGGIARGSIFVPIHWSSQTASDARVGALVNPVVDPISGEPEFKHTPAHIRHFAVAWYGFVLTREAIALDELAYWTKIQGARFMRFELAGRNKMKDPSAWARAVLHVDAPDADWLEYEDSTLGVYRGIHLVDDRIAACIFVSPRPDLPARNWLASLFAKERLDDSDRVGALLGRSAQKGEDTGPTVCSCFGVGRNTICNAIRAQKLASVAAITRCVKAGGNCGSCVPELAKLLAETQVDEAEL